MERSAKPKPFLGISTDDTDSDNMHVDQLVFIAFLHHTLHSEVTLALSLTEGGALAPSSGCCSNLLIISSTQVKQSPLVIP